MEDRATYQAKRTRPKGGIYRTDINVGDIIEFAGDKFLVLAHWGQSGKVQEYPGGKIIDPFAWNFEGEETKVVGRVEAAPQDELSLAECDALGKLARFINRYTLGDALIQLSQQERLLIASAVSRIGEALDKRVNQ